MKEIVSRYYPNRTFEVTSYLMRRGGKKRYASKVVCKDSGVVVLLTDRMDAQSAVVAAEKYLDTQPRFNGRSPADIEERIRNRSNNGDVVRAVKDLLEELAAVVPEDWAFTGAIKAAVEAKHCIRGG
jgi:hypothetical protein